MIRLSYDHLNVVAAVAEAKSFADAAQKLGVTQPTVSLKLKELERQLPVPLFQIEGKRKVLTHYGRALYEIAKANRDDIDRRIEDLNRSYGDAKKLTLRLAGRSEVLDFIAPKLSFAGRIELANCSSQEAVEKLSRHEIDIAITHITPDSAEIVAKRLFQSRAYFVVHEKWLKGRELNLSLVRSHSFLLETPSILYHRSGHILRDWLAHVGADIERANASFVTEDWRGMQSLVDAGAGYGIVPEYVEPRSKHVQRLELPTKVLAPFTYYALFEKGLKQIAPFRELLQFRLEI